MCSWAGRSARSARVRTVIVVGGPRAVPAQARTETL
jgi:hypothetical protein